MAEILLCPRLIGASLAYAFRNALEGIHCARFDDDATWFMNRIVAHDLWRQAGGAVESGNIELLLFPLRLTHARELADEMWVTGVADTGIARRAKLPPRRVSGALRRAAYALRDTANLWFNLSAAVRAKVPGDIRVHPLDVMNPGDYALFVPVTWDDPSVPVRGHFQPGRFPTELPRARAWAYRGVQTAAKVPDALAP